MKMSKQVLFDTNVLIYAQDKDSKYFSQAQRAHEVAISGEIRACVSLQNLTEFLSVITNPKRVPKPLTRSQAIGEVKKYLYSGVFSLIYPSKESADFLLKNVRFWQKSLPAHIFDVQLVATMLSNSVNCLLTLNVEDFIDFSMIETWDLRNL